MIRQMKNEIEALIKMQLTTFHFPPDEFAAGGSLLANKAVMCGGIFPEIAIVPPFSQLVCRDDVTTADHQSVVYTLPAGQFHQLYWIFNKPISITEVPFSTITKDQAKISGNISAMLIVIDPKLVTTCWPYDPRSRAQFELETAARKILQKVKFADLAGLTSTMVATYSSDKLESAIQNETNNKLSETGLMLQRVNVYLNCGENIHTLSKENIEKTLSLKVNAQRQGLEQNLLSRQLQTEIKLAELETKLDNAHNQPQEYQIQLENKQREQGRKQELILQLIEVCKDRMCSDKQRSDILAVIKEALLDQDGSLNLSEEHLTTNQQNGKAYATNPDLPLAGD